MPRPVAARAGSDRRGVLRRVLADYNYGGKAHGEELPGVSVFVKDDAGEVFHTYSTYGRGVEVMMHTYRLLDLTPKGRDEDGLDFTMAWVRHHDRYEPAPKKAAGSCCAP